MNFSEIVTGFFNGIAAYQFNNVKILFFIFLGVGMISAIVWAFWQYQINVNHIYNADPAVRRKSYVIAAFNWLAESWNASRFHHWLKRKKTAYRDLKFNLADHGTPWPDDKTPQREKKDDE